MKSLNLGILAHVDAGKTSLTERLLFNAGVIKTLGSVDQGNTQTDSLALERQRGITIKSAVTSFTIDDLKINLIDTPGHPDFIAEVERSLCVLDAVILVVSAVEGVQPQTRVLMRTLAKLHIPTLIFINKIDRIGARSTELVEDIRNKLFPRVITMNSVASIGTHDVEIKELTNSEAYLKELQTTLADSNETFLSSLVNNPSRLTPATCHNELVAQICQGKVCPIFFGSAINNIGVNELMQAIKAYLTPPSSNVHTPLSAVIFKIDRGMRDEKIAYVRIYSGKMYVRDQVKFTNTSGAIDTAKIIAMDTFEQGTTTRVSSAQAGDIVKITGLSDCSINDHIGETPPRNSEAVSLTRPSLEVIVTPHTAGDRSKLFNALQRISEQDPFIDVRQNLRDGMLSVRLCGEIQKEVIEDTLSHEFGIGVLFHETTAICIERPIGRGAGIEIGKRGDPYLGTVGLTIAQGPVGSGIDYKLASAVLGTMPTAFFVAIEETVYETLREGIYGWQVTDCIVTLTHSGFWPRQSHAHATFDKSMSSTAGDFRSMTPLALMAALTQAGTVVSEPMNQFELDIPAIVLAQTMQALGSVEAQLTTVPTSDQEVMHLEGIVPVRRTFEFERSVPDLTGGEGTFITDFKEYQEVRGVPPTRTRTDNNPLDRKEYLRRTSHRF